MYIYIYMRQGQGYPSSSPSHGFAFPSRPCGVVVDGRKTFKLW